MSQVAEPSPARSIAGAMANVGSVSRVALSEVLKTIAANELSGCLEITSGRSVRTVYFDRGFIVFTASNSEEDRLGQLLLKAGKIRESELDKALALMKGKSRIGEAIVSAGYLTEDELGYELASQARRIVTSLFALTQGMYRFESKNCPIPLELRLSLSLYRILLEGIREMKNESLITMALPPAESPLRLSKTPPFSFEDVRFLPIEVLVMEATQKARPIQAIVSRVGRFGRGGRVEKKRLDVLRATYGLLSAGILEPAGKHERTRRLKVQEEIGTFLLSKIDHESKRVKAENVRQEVLLEFENSERASAAELLEVDALASPDEIESAFTKRRELWQKKQKVLEQEKSLCMKVDEIQRRLARAKQELLENEKAAAEAEAKVDVGVGVGIEVEAPIPVVPLGPAPEPVADDSESSPAGEAQAIGSKAELKRLLKEIKLCKMVEDQEGVISHLYEVVALEPESAKYEALLAQALASHPVMKSKAERHFRRALSLDPQNAQIHYLLGRYYQSFDMKSRALAEFKAALAIDPKLSQARSAVVAIKGSADGTIQGKLKRLFV